MEVLSTKYSICTTMKILYSNGEDYYKDMEEKKKNGWKVATKPNFYNEKYEPVIKHSSNGTVITYVKYKKID